MKKLSPFLIIVLSLTFLISCTKNQLGMAPIGTQNSTAKVIPNVAQCGPGQHWDYYLMKCVDICPTGYHNDSITGACVADGGGTTTITVITNPNNPYDYSGSQHNNGVTSVLNEVNPSSPTLANDILHYTKLYGSSLNMDTTYFDSWYTYATAHNYFDLYGITYVVTPNNLNNLLYNNGRLDATSLNYLNSINNAIDNVITDESTPSQSAYSQIANNLISIENTIVSDNTLSSNEKMGLLQISAINRYTGAYWANYINNIGIQPSSINVPNLRIGKWWRRFWHADGTGAIGGAIGGSLGGWKSTLIGGLLGAVGGSVGYAIFGD